jgi:hypothetical protein
VASGRAAGPSSWLSGPQFAQPGISRVTYRGRVINVGSAGTTSRRQLLRMIGSGGLVAGAGTLAGCGAGHSATGAAAGGALSAAAATGPATLMIVRHAEKPPGSGSQLGVDEDGTNDKHSLVTTGWARAGALVELFASARNAPPAGLLKPATLYAQLGGVGKGQRAVETLTPLAARLGQRIVTPFRKGEEAKLADELRTLSGPTLLAWEHKGISAVVAHLGKIDPAPPSSWPRTRFDQVWVLTANGSGWRFQQVPQLLLAGDSPDPI